MRATIGIPTYNRRHLVALSAKSIAASALPSDTALIVIDDASTEYDATYLRSLFPPSSDVRRRPVNSGGASFAMRDLLEQLVASGADALLLLNSDLIVAPDFLTAALRWLPETDGMLSIFNTPSHAAIGARGPLIVKKTVGCAGTVWTLDVARKVLANVPPGRSFDWRFCDFLGTSGIAICVTPESLVQHAGFAAGENSTIARGDIGAGFGDRDAHNAYRLIELLMTDSQAKSREAQERAVALDYRLTLLEQRVKRIERLLGIGLASRIARLVRGRSK